MAPERARPELDEDFAARQARAALARFRLAPRYELTHDGARYAYMWWTAATGAAPHGASLPDDWFGAMDLPLSGEEESPTVAAAVVGFTRLPADRRRSLAGF